MYYKEAALVVPNVQSVEDRILQSLHDASYAGHVGGIVHHRTTAYHPQSNGQTERMNRVLEDMLRHYVNLRQSNWDTMLPVLSTTAGRKALRALLSS